MQVKETVDGVVGKLDIAGGHGQPLPYPGSAPD
jgi:hypothetical protein